MTVAGRRPDPGADTRDAELLSAVVGGDLTALRALYDRHAALAYGLALRLTDGQADRAGAVVESAFLRLWRTAHESGPSGSVRSRVIALVVGEARAHASVPAAFAQPSGTSSPAGRDRGAWVAEAVLGR